MSKARPIHPGATYVITRHTERGYCLLRPDRKMTQFILYALVVSAQLHNIQIHAFCAMPAYLQYVVTDTAGKLPQFLGMFHKLIGRGVKCLRKWDGALWNRKQTSVVELVTRAAVIDEIAHTLASPVATGLVRSARQWPGAKTLIDDIGREAISVARPNAYFGSNESEWAAMAHLKVAIPPSLAETPIQSIRDELQMALENLEAAAQKHYGANGFLGPGRVIKIQPESRSSCEASLARPMPPFVSARKSNQSRIDAARALRNFNTEYNNAFTIWRSGDRTVKFPAGTYAMRIFHGATIASRNTMQHPYR